MNEKIERAISLRDSGNQAEALVLLNEVLASEPSSSAASYQLAWTFDSLGRESEAAPFYEHALANGLKREDRQGAFLGLGSTYRCLGCYEQSLRVFDQGLLEFPSAREMKVFRALTLFNLGRVEEAMRTLLVQLIETSNDPEILAYKRALEFYSDKLTQVWK